MKIIVYLFVFLIGLHFTSCKILQQGVNALEPIGNLAKDSVQLEKFTRIAAQGFISGINIDSLITDLKLDSNSRIIGNGLTSGLNLDSIKGDISKILNKEINEIELKIISEKLSIQLKNVLKSEEVQMGLKSLISILKIYLENEKFNLSINPKISDSAISVLMVKLKDSILNDKNAYIFGNFLNNSLDTIAKGRGLDTLISKIISKTKIITTDTENKVLKILKKFWGIAMSIILLLIIYRLVKSKNNHLELNKILSEKIDGIKDQNEYDQILLSINREAEEKNVIKPLRNLINSNYKNYSQKIKYKNKSVSFNNVIKDLIRSDKNLQQRITENISDKDELIKYLNS